MTLPLEGSPRLDALSYRPELVGAKAVIQITPQMRSGWLWNLWTFAEGIDGLAALCRRELQPGTDERCVVRFRPSAQVDQDSGL